MKTSHSFKTTFTGFSVIIILVLIFAASPSILSQEVKTLFGPDQGTEFVWGFDLRTSTIQNEPGTQYGMYMGTLYGHSTLLAIVGAANVSHPRVNYGYIGAMVQYTYRPYSVVHLGGQLTVASGSTKDYEQQKSSTLDNFGNVTGAGFYMIEPAINTEINLGVKTRLILGLGYRIVNGIDNKSRFVSRTHLSDKDLTGLNITAGVKFGLY
jgi:hypothetical protein